MPRTPAEGAPRLVSPWLDAGAVAGAFGVVGAGVVDGTLNAETGGFEVGPDVGVEPEPTCTKPVEPVTLLPPPTWPVPVESVAVLPWPEPMFVGTPAVVPPAGVPVAPLLGPTVMPLDWIVPFEFEAEFPPPTWPVPAEFVALLPWPDAMFVGEPNVPPPTGVPVALAV